MEDKGGGEGQALRSPPPPPIFDWGNQRLGESKIGGIKDWGKKMEDADPLVFPSFGLFLLTFLQSKKVSKKGKKVSKKGKKVSKKGKKVSKKGKKRGKGR